MTTSFDKQGHRGCRGLMPENTIAAMIHAIDLGVTTLEMDIAFTKDNQAVVSHEPFFNHETTTLMDGSYIDEKEERSFNIFRMSYAEAATYDVGLKPYPRFPKQQKMKAIKPLLTELIDSVERYCHDHGLPLPRYNIETKTSPETDSIFHPRPKEFTDLLVMEIRSRHIEKRVTIQSFDIRTLQYLHYAYPEFSTSLLIQNNGARDFEEELQNLGFIPTIYSPDESLVTPELISACHKKKIKIIPWTVNDPATISKFERMGVDGLITDYPDLFQRQGK
ncbi:MAG: glycerophosphodiester phosphodiesterase family protein [Flavitalea sp.]